MKSVRLGKNISLTILFLSLYCYGADAKLLSDYVGTDNCPSIEQLRSGTVPGWNITAPNGISNEIIFGYASIANSSFAHDPSVRCIYKQIGGGLLEAQKKYYSTALRYDSSSWHWQNEPGPDLWHYLCTTSVTGCIWSVETVTYDSGPFP